MTRKPMTALIVVAALTPLAVSGLQPTKEGPPHGELAIDCGECHNKQHWVPVDRPSTFRHDRTGFVLEFAHASASCRSCHQSLVFNRVGTACADCHKDPHRGELGFRCESCHIPRTWSNQRDLWQAHSRTRFPLLAAHASLDCTACHRNQQPYQYATTPAECGKCHLPTYLATTRPNHVQSGFSQRCEDCHSITSPTWLGARFSHPATFPLAGGHAGVTCARCHSGGVYTGLSTDCYSCHRKDYQRTSNPNHSSSGFPTQCDRCHTINAWRPAKFDHGATRFPLTGAHASVDCAKCHQGGRYTGTPTDCYACHQANYAATTNPNHAAGHFSTQCQNCHNTGAWKPANFDHNTTRFPLTGAHTRVDCARCHVGGRYAGTPTDCYACHQANYTATTNPNHVASGFPTQCQTCHNTNAWRPASFDHNKTRFPLTGAHSQLDCARCHAGGRYTGTPTDCYACHQANYNATSNPNHAAASFPTQCQTCHTTSAWKPASFDHDGRYFPIYSGKHRGQWSSCNECHVSPSNYRVFECILCHAHSNRSQVDGHHGGVAGYQYASAACYNCHRSGVAGNARIRRGVGR
jgi:hypothetical protein